jgi:hypothetical protein
MQVASASFKKKRMLQLPNRLLGLLGGLLVAFRVLAVVLSIRRPFVNINTGWSARLRSSLGGGVVGGDRTSLSRVSGISATGDWEEPCSRSLPFPGYIITNHTSMNRECVIAEQYVPLSKA